MSLTNMIHNSVGPSILRSIENIFLGLFSPKKKQLNLDPAAPNDEPPPESPLVSPNCGFHTYDFKNISFHDFEDENFRNALWNHSPLVYVQQVLTVRATLSRAESLALQWRDIGHFSILVQRTFRKSKLRTYRYCERREVQMDDVVGDALRRWIDEHDKLGGVRATSIWLFPNRTGAHPLDDENYQKRILKPTIKELSRTFNLFPAV